MFRILNRIVLSAVMVPLCFVPFSSLFAHGGGGGGHGGGGHGGGHGGGGHGGHGGGHGGWHGGHGGRGGWHGGHGGWHGGHGHGGWHGHHGWHGHYYGHHGYYYGPGYGYYGYWGDGGYDPYFYGSPYYYDTYPGYYYSAPSTTIYLNDSYPDTYDNGYGGYDNSSYPQNSGQIPYGGSSVTQALLAWGTIKDRTLVKE